MWEPQIIAAMSGKQRLVVLDNFEHVREAAQALPPLLTAVPELTLLVTSRVVLNLQAERLYPLSGMNIPNDDTADTAASDAALLFAERARQVQPALLTGRDKKQRSRAYAACWMACRWQSNWRPPGCAS